MEAISASSGPSASRPNSGSSQIPLFHAAWLFAAGIVVAHWLWLGPTIMLLNLGLAAALSALAALRAERVAWVPLGVLWVLLGAWCAEMEPHPAAAPALARLSDGLLRTVEGTVVNAGPVQTAVEQNVDEPVATAPSQRVDLRVESAEVVTDESDAQTTVSGSVRLTVRWPDDAVKTQGLRCGERVRAVVRLLPPETYRDPGVWSRREYLLDQGITATGTVPIERIDELGQERGTFVACHLAEWQRAATEKLLALPGLMRGLPPALRLSEDDAIMLAAMVAGDRTYLTHGLRVGFERTGSFHMLVVSGFHLAIVAACVFWITRELRIPRVAATLLTIAASFGYALFTGFATPVQRSLWMVTVYLAGRLLYRDRSPLNAIGLAALCLLVVSPRSLFDSSFQMTLLAVTAIAGAAAPLLSRSIHPYWNAARDLKLIAVDVKMAPKLAQFRVLMRMVAEKLERAANGTVAWRAFPWAVRFGIRVVELVVVSCVVELAMTLPMAVYFHRITIFALPVNLLILPLLAVLMPAALVTLAALGVQPALAVAPGTVVALVLHFGVGLVHVFGSMALGDFRIPAPQMRQVAAFCGLLAAAIALARRSSTCEPVRPDQVAARHRWGFSRIRFLHRFGSRTAQTGMGAELLKAPGDATTSERWMRRGAWVMLALAALIAVIPRPVQRPHGALLMEAIDVGQGDSLLVITPDGKTLLVDGGGFGGGPRQSTQDFDIGEEVVSPALWARGIRHLDAVALSHAHSDHMGGLPAVLRNFHPDELWVGNNPRFGAYNALLDEAAALHVKVRSFRAGDGFAFGGTQVQVLAPFRDYVPGDAPTNNDSLVLHVAYGATSVMLEGDAEAPIEEAMLAEPDLQSTLLKVGHHGSITSTRPEFFKRVAPQLAVISCGLHNRYGHPRQEVLEELQEAHVRTFRTDINGASCFEMDGKKATAVQCAGVPYPP
jgi:competence protein ComEC